MHEVADDQAAGVLGAAFERMMRNRPGATDAAIIAANAGAIGSGSGEVEAAAAAIAAERAGETGPVRLTRDDNERFKGQRKQVFDLMIDGKWRTLEEISAALDGVSESSASARLRDFRKRAYGGYTVARRRRDPAFPVYEYRVTMPELLEGAARG